MTRFSVFLVALAMLISASSLASMPVSPQPRCSLTEETAPTVRGLRLGMNAQQFLALFPGISKKKEMRDAIEKAKSTTRDEATVLAVDPIAHGNPHQFAGVVSVAAAFYKGQAVNIIIQYSGANWTNVDEWIAKLSESFKLPSARDWMAGPDEAPNKILKCNGILISAAIQGGGSSIGLQNTTYLREIEQRARDAEETKRLQVKP